MASVQWQITGVQEVMDSLDAVMKTIPVSAADKVNALANLALSSVKRLTPVDESVHLVPSERKPGATRESWQKRQIDTFTQEVFTTDFVAWLLEYGVRPHTISGAGGKLAFFGTKEHSMKLIFVKTVKHPGIPAYAPARRTYSMLRGLLPDVEVSFHADVERAWNTKTMGVSKYSPSGIIKGKEE